MIINPVILAKAWKYLGTATTAYATLKPILKWVTSKKGAYMTEAKKVSYGLEGTRLVVSVDLNTDGEPMAGMFIDLKEVPAELLGKFFAQMEEAQNQEETSKAKTKKKVLKKK